MIEKVETSQKKFPPLVQLKLTEREGNFINGVLKKKLQDATYPKKQNYIITVKDLEGDTVLWNKEEKKEVETAVEVGQDVMVRGFTTLQTALSTIAEGAYVEIKFTGKGKARRGQKAPFLVDVGVER